MIAWASIDDVAHVAMRMRAADAVEVGACVGAGFHPLRWAEQVFEASRMPLAVIAPGGEAVAVGGFVPISAHAAAGWFVATDRLAEPWARPQAHALGLQVLRRAALAGHRRVEVRAIDGRPDVERWLRRLGFRWEGSHPAHGAGGETFHSYGWLAGRPAPRRRISPLAGALA